MKRILLIALIISLFASPAIPAERFELAGMVIGSGGAAASTTWIAPNGISTFTSDGGQLNAWAVANIVTPNAHAITKLRLNIYTLGTSTECSIGIYPDAAPPGTKLAGCHFTPVGTGWTGNECTVSYATSAATSYMVYAQCNDVSTTVGHNASTCGPHYTAGLYTQDMPASYAARAGDAGCYGMEMGY